MRLESPFSYWCEHCSDCCRSRLVSLNPYDIAQLARYLSISTGQFIDQYIFLSEQGAVLRHARSGECAWLSESGCLAYEHRPLACRTYPLVRQVSFDGQISLITLKSRDDGASAFRTDGTIETYLEQNQYKASADAADRYAALFVSLFKRLEQLDNSTSNAAILLADANLLQTILLDMNLMIACHAQNSQQAPNLEQKIQLHIDAINAWSIGKLETFVLLDAYAHTREPFLSTNHTFCSNIESEIEGCEWPMASSRLNAWAIALDYQSSKQVKLTQYTHESLLLQQLDILLKQHRQYSPFYRAQWAGGEISNLTYRHFRNIPTLHRQQLLDAGISLFSTQLPASHGRIVDQPSPDLNSTDRAIKTTELSLAFQKARYTGLQPEMQLAQRSHCTMILPGAISSKFKPGLHWANTPGSKLIGLDSSALPVSQLVASLLITRATNIITTHGIFVSLIQFMESHCIQIPSLDHVFVLQNIDISFHPGSQIPLFYTPVTEIFTLAEVGIIAAKKTQDEAYEVPDGHLLVEILNVRNNPCMDGEAGRIVVTDLHNFATPIIRYETGVAAAPLYTSALPGEQQGCNKFTLLGVSENA